ncbi:unnamed protein product [Microthlaspi erraticum]|uniref:Carbonic anhydrase n=1 Tax=Microthlaspi erraticum TaxID=1685480 RepID=A0A6D2IEI6_9BRAS|nr:unnamed protein product [Microthlaspi erraticum]
MLHQLRDNCVKIGAQARNKVKEEHQDLSDDHQCNKCEEEAVNVSLGNLLTYPYSRFVSAAVVKNTLAIRGAYYNFVKGTFDLWDLYFKTQDNSWCSFDSKEDSTNALYGLSNVAAWQRGGGEELKVHIAEEHCLESYKKELDKLADALKKSRSTMKLHKKSVSFFF